MSLFAIYALNSDQLKGLWYEMLVNPTQLLNPTVTASHDIRGKGVVIAMTSALAGLLAQHGLSEELRGNPFSDQQVLELHLGASGSCKLSDFDHLSSPVSIFLAHSLKDLTGDEAAFRTPPTKGVRACVILSSDESFGETW